MFLSARSPATTSAMIDPPPRAPRAGLVDSDRHVLDPVELRSHVGHVDLLPTGKALGRLRRRSVRPERGETFGPLRGVSASGS